MSFFGGLWGKKKTLALMWFVVLLCCGFFFFGDPRIGQTRCYCGMLFLKKNYVRPSLMGFLCIFFVKSDVRCSERISLSLFSLLPMLGLMNFLYV